MLVPTPVLSVWGMEEPLCSKCRRTFNNCACDSADWGFSLDAEEPFDPEAPDTIDPYTLGALEFAGISKQKARRKTWRRRIPGARVPR